MEVDLEASGRLRPPSRQRQNEETAAALVGQVFDSCEADA